MWGIGPRADDEDELHRRQAAICAGYGISLDDLEPMRWVSGVGNDNALMTFEGDGAYTTPMYDAIKKGAIDHSARLVVLDTAADPNTPPTVDRNRFGL